MKWTLRLLTTATVLTVGGFIVSNTTLAEDVGLDVWNLPDLEDQVTSAASLEAEMDKERTSVGRRIDWRHDIVADVLADRVTGAEAHALFLDANTSHPKANEYLRCLWPGRSDEERTARQLVKYVSVADHPRAKEIAAALECELLARFAAE